MPILWSIAPRCSGHLGELGSSTARGAPRSRSSRSASLPSPARTSSAYRRTSRIGIPVARSRVIMLDPGEVRARCSGGGRRRSGRPGEHQPVALVVAQRVRGQPGPLGGLGDRQGERGVEGRHRSSVPSQTLAVAPAPGTGAHVHPLALRPEQAEELDRPGRRRCRTSAARGCRTPPPRRAEHQVVARRAPAAAAAARRATRSPRASAGSGSRPRRRRRCSCLNACSPPGRRVSGRIVRPSAHASARVRTRGSPVGGAPTSSSSGTWWARASGSSSSRVGSRRPDSSRDSVLTEMPVVLGQLGQRRRPARCRSARSRGPTAASTLVDVVAHAPSLPFRQRCLPISARGRRTVEHGREHDRVRRGGGRRRRAGLSGALALARSRRSVLVVDAGEPRNAPAEACTTTWRREGISARASCSRRGRAEVAAYGGEIRRRARWSRPPRTRRRLRGRRWTTAATVAARRLLVTTGLVDELPDVAGLAERWGRDVLHCPYCHGWEVRDQAIGVLRAEPDGDAPGAAVPPADRRRHAVPATTPASPAARTREQLAAPRRHRGARRGRRGRGRRTTRSPASGWPTARSSRARRWSWRRASTARRRCSSRSALRGRDAGDGRRRVGSHVPADPTGAHRRCPGVWVAGNVTDLRRRWSPRRRPACGPAR